MVFQNISSSPFSALIQGVPNVLIPAAAEK